MRSGHAPERIPDYQLDLVGWSRLPGAQATVLLAPGLGIGAILMPRAGLVERPACAALLSLGALTIVLARLDLLGLPATAVAIESARLAVSAPGL